MKAEIKAKWVAALRSRKYQQCYRGLHNGIGFCALGVLCELHRLETNGSWVDGKYLGERSGLPEDVYNWAGIETTYVMFGGKSVACLNDGKATFKELADWIESHL